MDALSQIDYRHTLDTAYEDWREVCLCQPKMPKVFLIGKFEEGYAHGGR